MKINIHEIEAATKELAYDEPTADLNAMLGHGSARDFDFPAPLHVAVAYYRAGQDLFFKGTMTGPVIGHCARCLEDFAVDLSRDFAFVLAPFEEGIEPAADDDLSLAFYRGDVIDLSPLLREQILLSLPTRALCREECRGLCPQCGANRTVAACNCAEQAGGDPRLAALRGLKVRH